jgi:hypothetical protein
MKLGVEGWAAVGRRAPIETIFARTVPPPKSCRPSGLGWQASACVMVGILCASAAARANGAFPDSLQIMLPADRPHEIVLSTNFGLISSEDDGATWLWSCEQAATTLANLYQMGPAPLDRLFAIAFSGLAYSDDGACSWMASQGSLASAVATDAFPDPTDAQRVLAIATVSADGGGSMKSLYVSTDGGATFGAPLYTAPAGGGLLSVESAASDPMTIYLSAYTSPGIQPQLVRSSDGGVSWSSIDLQPMVGSNGFRIIAVDPQDPRRLFLRVTEAAADKLGVSTNGGATIAEPVAIANGMLTSFALLPSGTVLVGGLTSGGAPAAFRSTDGGVTFQPWPSAPRLRALGVRGDKLYAVADNFRDGFAVGVSTDEGMTFQPLLTFGQVMGIKPCVSAVCQDSCDNLALIGLWSPDTVCGGAARPDGGGTPPPASKGGCGCDLAGGGARGSGLALAVVVTVAAGRRRRRRNVTRRQGGKRSTDMEGQCRFVVLCSRRLCAWLGP